MVKKSLIIFLLLISAVSVNADNYDSKGYVGTPPGFYDDIDPNNLDEDNEEHLDNIKGNRNPDNNTNSSVHEFTDDDVIIVPDQNKATKDYNQIYNNLEPADFSYLHNIDPDQYHDMKDTAWSMYPLLRLNSAIYFKGATIEPGYYLLTPREHNGKWYMLFKQNGNVVHIIPVYDRDYTPENFYDKHIPKPKLTKAQKIHMGVLGFIGKFDSSKRKEPVKSFLEVNDLENYFVSIVIYYGGHKYSTIFRTIRL